MHNQHCTNCRAPIAVNAQFCDRCGAQQVHQPPQGQQQQQYTQNPPQQQYPPPQQQYPPPQQHTQYPPQQQYAQYPPPQPQQQYSQYPPPYPHLSQPIDNTPGGKIIRVVSILCIIFGALGMLIHIGSAYVLVDPFQWLWMFGGEAMLGAWRFYYIAPIFIYAYVTIVGILGVMNSQNREKAGLLLGLGVACISATILYYVIIAFLGVFAYLGDLGMMSLILMPADFVLPILLIIGARKNMSQ